MDVDKIRDRVQNDPDYVECSRFKYSAEYAIKKNPDGLDDKTIAKILMVTTNNVKRFYESAVKKMRKKLKININ